MTLKPKTGPRRTKRGSDDQKRDRTLEPPPDAMRGMIEQVSERVIAHIATLHEQPASHADVDLARQFEGVAIDGDPADLEQLLELLFDRLAPRSFNSAGPGFMAYIPGGGLFHTALADLIADSLNRYTTVWAAAPGLAEVEASVIRWFCDMVGYPASSGGFLSSGGSMANLSAVVAARRDRLRTRLHYGTIYTSDQTHHSVLKAAMIAGIPPENVRQIESDEQFRIRPDLLERRVMSDRAMGYEPFLVCSNAGTTNSGAVDPLEEIAELAVRHSLWFHVDAAYGGLFMLTERGRERMRGIERADSITLDPHKGLFLPYGTGCLIVRQVGTLRRAFSVRADYMPALQDTDAQIDISEISPELTRGFRGLRVWLPMKLLGQETFRRALDEKLDLIDVAENRLRSMPGIEIVARPQLSTLAFRLVASELDGAETDKLNRRLLDAINAKRRVFLTSTRLRDAVVIRICVLSFRTHADRMEMCLEDIASACESVLSGA